MLVLWVLHAALERIVARLPSILLLQVTPDVKLDLPQVAVVGSQSSGKSSVLEALVRRAVAVTFILVFCTSDLGRHSSPHLCARWESPHRCKLVALGLSHRQDVPQTDPTSHLPL
jgi:hypothetical protein